MKDIMIMIAGTPAGVAGGTKGTGTLWKFRNHCDGNEPQVSRVQ